MNKEKNFLNALDDWGTILTDTYDANQNKVICKLTSDDIEYKVEVYDPNDIQLITESLRYSRDPFYKVHFTSNKKDIKFRIIDSLTNKYYDVSRFDFDFHGHYNLYDININKPIIKIVITYKEGDKPRNLLIIHDNTILNNDINYINDTIINAIIKNANSNKTENHSLFYNLDFLNSINK